MISSSRSATRSATPSSRSTCAAIPSLSSTSVWRSDSDRKSTCLNSSHDQTSYAVFCLKKKKYGSDNPSVNSHHHPYPFAVSQFPNPVLIGVLNGNGDLIHLILLFFVIHDPGV